MTTTLQERPAGALPATAPAEAAVSGIVDIRETGAFVRTSGYRVGPHDVHVPTPMIKQHGLRRGDLVEGAARPADQMTGRGPARGAAQPNRRPPNGAAQPNRRPANGRGQGNSRAKFPVLTRLDTVNGNPAPSARSRPDFDKLTPLYPQQRLRLEAGSGATAARIIDLLSPIGKGQRGLIVSPPKAGKTMVLQAIAAAIAAGNPQAHLMVVLVGERPEEVTDMRRTVRGEVVASTFDQPADDHILVAELAIERAKRLAELGADVVVLLDSITRLGRAYNLAAPASSRILAGGVATSALHPPRALLGAARNTEEGGSLTLLCTALVETGSRMDDVLFEEFKGTGNMELRLRRDLAEKRLFPAVDVAASGTRRDDLLMPPAERGAVNKLRKALAGLDPQQALELLLAKTADTPSNAEFLRQVDVSGR